MPGDLVKCIRPDEHIGDNELYTVEQVRQRGQYIMIGLVGVLKGDTAFFDNRFELVKENKMTLVVGQKAKVIRSSKYFDGQMELGCIVTIRNTSSDGTSVDVTYANGGGGWGWDADRFEAITEPKVHPHAALIKQWAEGAEIEYFSGSMQDWRSTNEPSWSPGIKYRIRPVNKVVYLNMYEDSTGGRYESYKSAVKGQTGDAIGVLKITTCKGKLVSVETVSE